MKYGYKSTKNIFGWITSFFVEKPKRKIKPYSKKSIDWLNYRSQYDGVFIQHAENLGEYRIPGTRYKADGYSAKSNTVFEFMGTWYHADPRVYKRTDYNPQVKKTMGELYDKTMKREKEIKKLGYNMVTMWEYDWDKMCKNKQNRVGWGRYIGMKLYSLLPF